jgi:hypothetical protein
MNIISVLYHSMKKVTFRNNFLFNNLRYNDVGKKIYESHFKYKIIYLIILIKKFHFFYSNYQSKKFIGLYLAFCIIDIA